HSGQASTHPLVLRPPSFSSAPAPTPLYTLSLHDALPISRELKTQQDLAVANFDIPWGHEISDDLLRLVFVSCHPVLSTEARVALTLRLLGGLTTREIARAFLVPEPTVAQRIVRAKRTLTEARVPF